MNNEPSSSDSTSQHILKLLAKYSQTSLIWLTTHLIVKNYITGFNQSCMRSIGRYMYTLLVQNQSLVQIFNHWASLSAQFNQDSLIYVVISNILGYLEKDYSYRLQFSLYFF